MVLDTECFKDRVIEPRDLWRLGTWAGNNTAILCLDVCLLNRKIRFTNASKESR